MLILNLMNIGVFDSGLGGLVVLKAIMSKLPQFSYIYLGDTARMPYGNKSQEVIYHSARAGIEFLLKDMNCQLVITACNTVSAEALKKLQEEYLPQEFPGDGLPTRRILGVIIPTAEHVARLGYDKVGLLATKSTVSSHAYEREVHKINPSIEIISQAAPLLVPLIEEGWSNKEVTKTVLREYLEPLKLQNVQAVIPGCTHFPLLRDLMQQEVGKNCEVVDAPEVIANALASYLTRHREITEKLTTSNPTLTCHVTDHNPLYSEYSFTLFGKQVEFKKIDL